MMGGYKDWKRHSHDVISYKVERIRLMANLFFFFFFFFFIKAQFSRNELCVGFLYFVVLRSEPRHDNTNKVSVRSAKTQFSLGIRTVWSESSLSAWRNLWSLATHWAHSEDSDQTRRMPRPIWVFAGRTLLVLVFSCPGSLLYSSSLRQERAANCDLAHSKDHSTISVLLHVPHKPGVIQHGCQQLIKRPIEFSKNLSCFLFHVSSRFLSFCFKLSVRISYSFHGT